MSRPPRFTALRVFNRNGRVVAQIADAKTGTDMWIHRVGSIYLHWDKNDRRVDNGLLRFAARCALDEYENGEAVAEPAALVDGVRQCRRCPRKFRPASKVSRAKLCRFCRAEVSKRNREATRLARAEA